MAKWGQGDPRWIVEERPDATNVNNWHWTEKEASSWSKDKLKELLVDLIIDDEHVGCCTINEMEKCVGEASASNRKAKLIFFYEWDIKLKWKGVLNGSDEGIEGTIKIPNLSEENSIDEVEIAITTSTHTEIARKVKDFMRVKGTPLIREKLDQYVNSLKKEFSQGMILPKKDAGSEERLRQEVAKFNPLKQETNNTDSQKTKSSVGCKLDVTTIDKTQNFKCTVQELYNALTVTEMVQAFTHGAIKLELKKGGVFEFFGGNVHGEFVELVPNEKIVQKWRFKSWPAGHYSLVTLSFMDKEDSTDIHLIQTGVPKSELEKTCDGWERYYWESLRRTFGFGAFIL